MTASTPFINLTPVMRTLEQGGCTLTQLWHDHAALWQALGWVESQVLLWVSCLPAMEIDKLVSDGPRYRLAGAAAAAPSLADHIVAVLASLAKPMPLMQLMGKLPAGMLVTDVMLRNAIQADARMELKGPLVKLV